ncbi:Senescence regulator [Corchorus capsularis]|uniref:Senescence regulator n=1 Tax=Corchorus capsularis TaxID=210143 RepID=A0A1R3HB35_COCAP|nr:Senescence regulator [Corchorus capsularis]
MASSKSYYSRPNYRFLSSDQQLQTTLSNDSAAFELDESDIYNNSVSTRSDSPEFRSSRVAKKPSSKRGGGASGVGGTPASLPVNIPDWSKILREEYRDNRRRSESDDDDVEGDDWSEGGVRIPPHEFLAKQMARTRIASFSVHEGIGRTLKGRDLRRVRNAIFEKTGFQD